MNTLGRFLRLTSFGESHGPGVGAVLDGFPAGYLFPEKDIHKALQRRRPGQNAWVSPRNEPENLQILSGVFEGKTTGAPITFFIPNADVKSGDYDHLRDVFRPNHADFTWQNKYGHRDYRGGGRTSARVTAAWVAAGAMAQAFLNEQAGISIAAFVSAIGPHQMPEQEATPSLEAIESSELRCPHPETSAFMKQAIEAAKTEGDSLGGIISGIVSGMPIGLGEPLFAKLHAELGHAMLTINAVKGFEFGGGFEAAKIRGSQFNDAFQPAEEGKVITQTNHSGGIQGGLSNGQDLRFRVAFHPVATIGKAQQTVNTLGEAVVLEAKGRHDVCVVPRAVPIVEAMTALVIMDAWLGNKLSRLPF